MIRELQALRDHALRQPVVIVLTTVALVSIILYWKETRQEPHQAVIVIRIADRNDANETLVSNPSHLENHVRRIALSNAQILDIVDRHRLYPTRQNEGPDSSIAAFRANLRMASVGNYAAELRQYDRTAPSASFTLRFQDRDAETSFSVANDIAAAFASNQATSATLKDVGPHLDVVDVIPPEPRVPTSWPELGLCFLALFVLVLPLIAIGHGAIGKRWESLRDRREPQGEVP